MFEIDSKTFRWLLNYKLLTPHNVKQLSSTAFEIKQPLPNQFQNGIKISQIVIEIYKKSGLVIPATLNHLKQTNGTAAELYNWNIINDALKKINFQIDSETKNLIINGDRMHLAMLIRKLITLYQNTNIEDSLDNYTITKPSINHHPNPTQQLKQSLTLSKSQQPQKLTNTLQTKSQNRNHYQNNKPQPKMLMASGDLLQFVINQLMINLKLTMKQTIALLSDNNKYLAHVLVKGIKGQFTEIQTLLQKFYSEIDYIVQKMLQQNDMCYYFLQIIKPCLLSKNEEIAQWGCRILTKIAHELAVKEMLPLAYDWFVQQAGGLSTTILALSRQPKLSQNVVSYILEFSRYNVTQLFTIELRKITNNDNLIYIKFMLLIFTPLAQSKISAEQLLQSGAIDYWLEISLKGAENDPNNSKQLRIYCIEFLIKLWRSYPAHIEETLDQVNNIMNQVKKGIRDQSQVMRFTLMEIMFDLLDQFASKKNPYASIVYKKLTFLFIENHDEITMREFILRNLQSIFQKYQSIPVDIFLEPFIKQIKISQSKSYLVNIFDIQFINIAVRHHKLKVSIALQLFDLLAKTKLNSYSFSVFATDAMQYLISRFLSQQLFLEYCIKLVKISLAMFYSTLKEKKPFEEQQRLKAQKRAEIVNLIICLIEKSHPQLNEQIKNLTVHVKVQIIKKFGIEHKGIERILSYFPDIDQTLRQAIDNYQDQLTSNATHSAKSSNTAFHLPKITRKPNQIHDQTQSQQSLRSNNTKYSQNSKQQFPQKDYTQFVSQDQKKFLKQNGISIKKPKKKPFSIQKQSIDPKIQQQLLKIKLKKQQQEKNKIKSKQLSEKKKQILKSKIQKQLQHRNLKLGYKGFEKDVDVQLLFEENYINDHILEQQTEYPQINIDQQQDRNRQSISLILKKHTQFLKKLFHRYTNISGAKKDLSQAQNPQISQVLLLRLCKQKSLERSKNTVIQLMKQVNNKNVTSMSLETFYKFLASLCVSVYVREKYATKVLMGDVLKRMLKKMSEGQNFKLDQDDDPLCRQLTQKIQYNPHISLPETHKKIYERTYKINETAVSYPVKKSINNEAYIACYQLLNQLLSNTFKFNIMEEEVRFIEEGRVVNRRQVYIPPKLLPKKEKQQTTLPLLAEKQNSSQYNRPKLINRSLNKPREPPLQKQPTYSRSRSKILNQVQKKKLDYQSQLIKKKSLQQQLRKHRALQVKHQLEKQQLQYQKQKQKKYQEKQLLLLQQQMKIKKQKQIKQKYHLEQKQKISKFKKQQQDKQKQQLNKNQQQKYKQEELRKYKLKQQFKKQQQRRKQQYDKIKKQKQLSIQKNKKYQQNQNKKKQLLKKQITKQLQNQKSKSSLAKIQKQLIDKLYNQPPIQQLLNHKYKQQLKAIFNYGRQYNQYKIDKTNTTIMEQKGWILICQQLNLCDPNTAAKILKLHIKEKTTQGFTLDEFKKNLFEFAVKNYINSDSSDYDQLTKSCEDKFKHYLAEFKFPKSTNKLKQYFINLKNQINSTIQPSKKKQQLIVVNPAGQKQTWELKQ